MNPPTMSRVSSIFRPFLVRALCTLVVLFAPTAMLGAGSAAAVTYDPLTNPVGNLNGIPLGNSVSYPITVTAPDIDFPTGVTSGFHFTVTPTSWPSGISQSAAAGLVTVALAPADAGLTVFDHKDQLVHFIVTVNFATPAVAGTYAFTVTEDNWPFPAGSYDNAGHQINATSVPVPPPSNPPPTVGISSPVPTPAYGVLSGIPLNFTIQSPALDPVLPAVGLTVQLGVNQLSLTDVIIDSNTIDLIGGKQTMTGHAALSVPAAGTYLVKVTAGNLLGGTASTSTSFTVVVQTPPTITSGNTTTFTVGQPGAFTVTASGSPTPTYNISGQPSWLTINSVTGILGGTPPASAAGASFVFTVKATNGVTPDATQSFTLNVVSPPAFTSANSATFASGVPGSFTVTASGSPLPTLSVGTLPDWLTFTAGARTGQGVLSGTPPAGAGPTVTLTFAANNDVGTAVNQTFILTITNTAATIALTNLAATYDGTPKPVVATTNPAGLSVTLTYTGTNVSYPASTTAPTNAGSYSVLATISSPGYQGSASGTLVIAKAPLTITADNKTRAYGAANPTLTASYSGFVHGETAAVVSGLVLSTTAGATSVPGAYDVLASGATAANYAITFKKGTLTVAKADQSIAFGAPAAKSVGDAAFTLGATASSGLAVTYTSSNNAVATVSGSTVTIVGAGTATITASQAGNGNYNAAPSVGQILTVTGAKTYSLCGTVFFDINYNGVFDVVGDDDDDHWDGDHHSSSYGDNDWSDCRGSRYDRYWDLGRGCDYGDRFNCRYDDDSDEQNAEDFGLGGVTVNLLNSKGKVIATVVTAADGTYCFANLAPGTYTASVIEPNGFDATTQTTRTVTITNKNVVVRDVGMGLDLTEICNKRANGNSDDFWDTQLDKCIRGDTRNVQVNAATCTAHTTKIGSLALSVFDNITMKTARSLLENNSRSSRDQLSRQLIAAEYNYANGAFIDGDKTYTYCFIQWGERVSKYPSSYSSSYAQWAANWFEAYNTSGGGKIGNPQ